MATKSIILGMIVSLLLSCSTNNGIDFLEAPTVINNPNYSVPLSAYLNFTTKEEFSSITINLKSNSGVQLFKYDRSEKSENGFPLYFFHPDTEYKVYFELTGFKDKVLTYKDTLSWKSPSLPDDPRSFPEIVVTKSEVGKMEEGYTLMNPRRRIPMSIPGANELNKSFGMLLAVDSDGTVVWYYKTDSRISDFDILPDGTISYMTQDSRLTIIDMMGNIKKSWYAEHRPEGEVDSAIAVDALTFHHDATYLPNGNIAVLSSEYQEISNYFTSETDKNAPRKTQKVMGDVIKEFTPSGKVVWEWNAYDYLDPFRIGYETFSEYWERRGFPGVIDWSHANTILFNEDDDAYIINFRYQSALMEIDKKTKEINWIFGEPSGWSKNLQKKLIKLEGDSEWFWHQHSPSLTPAGNILIFNNSNYHARPFEKPIDRLSTRSHAVEYKINEETFIAKEVWTSLNDADENIVSVAMGDVDYLPNGNILAAYGALVSDVTQWTMIREFERTIPANVVWELRLVPKDEQSKVGWTIFGAERF